MRGKSMSKIISRSNFKSIRIKAGKSQNELAKLTETTVGTISRLENQLSGTSPKTAKAIATVLGVEFDELFHIVNHEELKQEEVGADDGK